MEDKRKIQGITTYNKIISSTIELISEEGINQISASKISRKSEIGKSTLFHHVESINELLINVLNEIIDLTMKGALSNKSITIEDALNSIGEFMFLGMENNNHIKRAFFAFYYEGIFNGNYREIFNNYLKQATIEIIDVLKSFDFDEDEAMSLAKLCIATLDGLWIHIAVTGDSEGYLASWEWFKKAVVDSHNKKVVKK